MGALGATTPKPLLPIDGGDPTRTFLDWHLRALAAAGVGEVYLVGSGRTYGARVAAMADVAATWILNPRDPSASGSAHSAWFAWQSPHRILDGRSRVLLMDADIVYDPALLGDLLAARGPASKILVATAHAATGEEVLVYADPVVPTRAQQLGKGLAGRPRTRGLVCLGEATGITLWEPADHDPLARATDLAVDESPAGARSEHEDVTQTMMDAGPVETVCFGPEHPFLEVDTAEDYRELVENVAPRLRARAVKPA
jgi:choline kinase